MIEVMDNTKSKRLLATECSEPERSEGERNAVANNPAAAPPPDPEVSAKARRRRFTPTYKAGVVEEAMTCTEHGQIGALLRREGLYSSALALGVDNTSAAPSRLSRTINVAVNAHATPEVRNWNVYGVRLSN